MESLGPIHLKDAGWLGFLRTLGRWRCGLASGSDVVDWAVDALVAGWESDSIQILAGLAKPPNEFEVERYLGRMMAELGVEMPERTRLIELYAHGVAASIVAGTMSAYDGTRELRLLWLASRYPAWLGAWSLLEDEWEAARDGFFGSVADVEDRILAEARRLASES